MPEANTSLSQAHSLVDRAWVRVEALRLARNAVKLRISDSGDKLSHWAMKDINALAEARWREFLGEATLNLVRWSERKSKVVHNERRPENQWLRLCRYQVRNNHRIWQGQHRWADPR